LQQQRKRAAATKAKGPRQKFISFQMFLFLAFASRRRPRGLQIRIKTNAKEAKVASAFFDSYLPVPRGAICFPRFPFCLCVAIAKSKGRL
jgi:hypothetical protein